MLNLYKYMYYVGGVVSLIGAFLYFTTEKYILLVFLSFVVCMAGRMLYHRTAARMAEEQARMRRREARNKAQQ